MVSQEALTRLLVEKGVFTEEEFLEMVRIVDQEMRRKGKPKTHGVKYSD